MSSKRRRALARGLYPAAVGGLLLDRALSGAVAVLFSLRTEQESFRMPPRLLVMPTLQNYVDLWQGKFLRAFENSAVTASATTLLSLLLGVPAAYALSRAGLRSERFLSLWVLATRMAPPIAFGIPFFLIYKELGLIDTRLGLVVIYLSFNLSLVIWMMRAFFDGLPRSLEEAAYIDGAGVLGAFVRVTLPLCAPGLATTAIFCFLLSVERLLLLADSHSERCPHRPGGHRELHELRELGVRQDQRGGHPHHAAGGGVFPGRPPISDPRPHGRGRQRLTRRGTMQDARLATASTAGSFLPAPLAAGGAVAAGRTVAAQTRRTIKMMQVSHAYSDGLSAQLGEFERKDRYQGGVDLHVLPGLEPAGRSRAGQRSGAYDVIQMIFIRSGRWIRAGWAEPAQPVPRQGQGRRPARFRRGGDGPLPPRRHDLRAALASRQHG